MDKNQVTGLILISAMLVGYLYFFSEQPSVNQGENASQEIVDSSYSESIQSSKTTSDIKSSEKIVDQAPVLGTDSVSVQKEMIKWGSLYSATAGIEKIFKIENDLLRLEISSKGSSINKVVLKKHLTYEKDTLILLDKENHEMKWLFPTKKGDKIDISELYYDGNKTLNENGDQVLTLKTNSQNGSISHTFTLPEDSYEVNYKIQVEGLSDVLAVERVELRWDERLKRFENVLEQSRSHTAVNYYDTKGDFNDVTNDTDGEKVTESGINDIVWFSMKQKYFNSGIISTVPMLNGEFSSKFNVEDSSVLKSQTAKVEIPFEAFSSPEQSFKFYFGPNNFSILKKVTEGYGDNVYLGWAIFATVNKYTVVPFFNFLEKYVSNYGLIILILVFIVKLILSPLSYKSYVSMAKMKVLKPEIEEIKKKLGDDQQKVQMETMQLYQQFGVNPLSGCIPMVLQIPVLFALFNFFPNSVELRQKSFLWADDLSTYDSILDLSFNIPFYGDHVSLFTLLMTLSTLAYTYVQNQNNPMQQQGPMKTMQYFFPVMIMFFLNNFSAGLTYYYFLSNVITISQQLLIAKFTDDKAIRSKLEEKKNTRSTKKKSGFSARIEEAMKVQQDKKKPQDKKTNKK